MINAWIVLIFFQRKKTNAMVKTPPYSPKVMGLKLFFKNFIHKQNGWKYIAFGKKI
jgi:hypothetical protein